MDYKSVKKRIYICREVVYMGNDIVDFLLGW